MRHKIIDKHPRIDLSDETKYDPVLVGILARQVIDLFMKEIVTTDKEDTDDD